MQKYPNLNFKMTLILLMCALLSPKAFAAKILKSNAKQAIIQLEELEFSITQNDQVVVMNNSKRVGILKITKIADGKAKADILKGTAPVGASVVTLAGGSGDAKDSTSSFSKRKWRYGGVLGYFLDSQSTTLTQGASYSESVAQTGSGYGAKAFAELPISGNLWFQGRFGIETFNVSGSAVKAVCTGPSVSCSTSIMYVSGDAFLKYNFPLKSFTPFGQVGLGLFYPLTKSSTALDSIPAISVFLVGAGADIKLNTKAFIPIYFEYGYFPPSTQVTTNFMGLMLGYGISL